MRDFLKKIFHWTNPRRWFALIVAFFATIIAILLGSLLFLNSNTLQNNNYTNGSQVVARIKDSEGEVASSQLSTTVSTNLSNLLTSGSGLSGASITMLGDGTIVVSDPNAKTEAQLSALTNAVINKGQFVATNTSGVPLFIDGAYNSASTTIDYQNYSEVDWSIYQIPIAENGATTAINQSGGTNVRVSLTSAGQSAWATMLVSLLQATDQTIVLWYNLEEFVQIASNSTNLADFAAASYNPYNFAFVNNSPTTTTDTTTSTTAPNTLKTATIDSANYFISTITVDVNTFQSNRSSIVINGDFNSTEAKSWVFKINNTTSTYTVETMSANFISASNGSTAWRNVIITLAFAFAALVAYLVYQYGLIGFIASIALALFTFATVLVFTALNGEWSPGSIVGLTIGVALALNGLFIVLEKMKQRLKQGDTFSKAFKSSSNTSWLNTFDNNLTTILIGAILFFFGYRSVRGFSLTLILAIVFGILIMVVGFYFVIRLLIVTGTLDRMQANKVALAGNHQRLENKRVAKFNKFMNRFKVDNFNFIKNSKWFTIALGVFLLVGLLVYVSLSGVNQSAVAAFNTSTNFSAGTNWYIGINNSDASTTYLSETNAQAIIDAVKGTNVFDESLTTFSILPSRLDSLTNSVQIVSQQTLTSDQIQTVKDALNALSDTISNLNVDNVVIRTGLQGYVSLINVLIVLAIIVGSIGFYTLIRIKWAFAVSIIISLIADLALIISAYLIFRLVVDDLFMTLLVAAMAYSATDKIALASRVNETKNTIFYNVPMDLINIRNIANTAVSLNFRKGIISHLALAIIVLPFLIFQNVIGISFAIGILSMLVITLITSNFINIYLWTVFETFRNRKIRKRQVQNFWSSGKVEEQIFTGFNDFKY